MRSFLLCAALVAIPAAVSAQPPVSDQGLDGFVRVDRLPVPEDPVLAEGRRIWGDTCENCHGGNKLTGAPKITSAKAWAPRIDKGLDTLVAHAIGGFMGPKFTEMPARGGDDSLSDAQVGAAVAFMVWASGGAAPAMTYSKTLE